MPLHHVTFHTWHNLPVFENESYDRMMRHCLDDVIAARGILCPAWELLPAHVHLIVEDFTDLPRSVVMKYLKGDTARAFFATFPDLRADLQGGHLWQKGYYAVAIVSHQQYLATVRYVRNNRAQPGLVTPWPTLGVVES